MYRNTLETNNIINCTCLSHVDSIDIEVVYGLHLCLYMLHIFNFCFISLLNVFAGGASPLDPLYKKNMNIVGLSARRIYLVACLAMKENMIFHQKCPKKQNAKI